VSIAGSIFYIKLGIGSFFNLKLLTSALKLSALGSVLKMTSTSLTKGEIEAKSYLLVRILNPVKRSLGMLPDLTKN
jgi:hypothetical protein